METDDNEHTEWKKGHFVKLKGLSIPELNGRTGMIISNETFPTDGRYGVKLDSPYTSPSTRQLCDEPISIKAVNLERCKANHSSLTCYGCRMQFAAEELMKCSKCRMVSYCSRNCQISHWKREHREECKLLSTARNSASNSGHADSSNNIYDDEIMSMRPTDRIWAIQNRGMCHLGQGDPQSAEKDFRYLVENEHFHAPGIYVNLASCLMQQNKVQEAIPYLEKAVTLQPIEAPNELKIAYEMLATAYHMADNIPKYKTTLERGLEQYPGDHQFLTMMQQFDNSR
eukprot:Nitzschia sp. Nitz4//scaffold254_size28068//18687//19541//NITZ4_008154-RA/size28068-processed-gene-0.8-mRNA-1//-1//CDS//3329544340//5198//frame0